MCPRCHCPALPHVLAAHLHPRAAPTSPGLLLVRLTASDTLTNTAGIFLMNVYTLSFSIHFLIHTHLTRTDAHTRTHTTPCVAVMRRALTLKLRCKRADAHVRTFSGSFAETLPRSLAPRYNEGPGSPCSIFHAGANAALPSFKPSQGFVSTQLMQIQQI